MTSRGDLVTLRVAPLRRETVLRVHLEAAVQDPAQNENEPSFRNDQESWTVSEQH